MSHIIVVGWPRSGNVWLARLLGDVLDRPVVGVQEGRGSLAAEGGDRPGDSYVMQAHLWPSIGNAYACGHLQVDLRFAGDRQFIQILRDPRDIATSAAAYWDWTIDEALDRMIEGPGPLDLPPWDVFVMKWMDKGIPSICYEDLHKDTAWGLHVALSFLDQQPVKPLDKVVRRQSFAVKKRVMQQRGKEYPFGRKAQLKHLRRGDTGEWREVFTGLQAQRAMMAWEHLLQMLGYSA